MVCAPLCPQQGHGALTLAAFTCSTGGGGVCINFNIRFSHLVCWRYILIQQSDTAMQRSHGTGTIQRLRYIPESLFSRDGIPSLRMLTATALGSPSCREGRAG